MHVTVPNFQHAVLTLPLSTSSLTFPSMGSPSSSALVSTDLMCATSSSLRLSVRSISSGAARAAQGCEDSSSLCRLACIWDTFSEYAQLGDAPADAEEEEEKEEEDGTIMDCGCSEEVLLVAGDAASDGDDDDDDDDDDGEDDEEAAEVFRDAGFDDAGDDFFFLSDWQRVMECRRWRADDRLAEEDDDHLDGDRLARSRATANMN